MKWLIPFVLGILLGAGGVIGGYFYFSTREAGDDMLTIVFTEEEIQDKIGRKFPKEEEILRYMKLVVDEPKVTFLGKKNRLQIAVEAKLIIPFLRTDTVGGVFESSVRYEKEDKTLRISDFEVVSLNTEELPKEYEGMVRAAFNLLALKLLDDKVIHTIKKKDLGDQVADLLLQRINIKKGELEVVLGL